MARWESSNSAVHAIPFFCRAAGGPVYRTVISIRYNETIYRIDIRCKKGRGSSSSQAVMAGFRLGSGNGTGMYELFLLGKVLERPWHGYEFHQVLNAVVGPARKVSWGTIYPLLQRMEKAGLVHRVSEPSDKEDGRGRQRFSITEKGKQRFLQLMRSEPSNDPNYRETFRIKLGNFSRVDAAIRRGILDRYLERLSSISTHTKAMSELVSKVPEMGESERRNILLALAHDGFLAESEAKWIRGKFQEYSLRHSGKAGSKA